jgi:hypothetical protein
MSNLVMMGLMCMWIVEIDAIGQHTRLRKQGEKPSSLFEAYAMYPYGGYYMQPAYPPPMFPQQSPPQIQAPVFGPGQPGYPPMYAPYYMPPPAGYYQQPPPAAVAFPQPPAYAPPQAPELSAAIRPPPAPPVTEQKRVSEEPEGLIRTERFPEETKRIPPAHLTIPSDEQLIPTKNPLKEALTDALKEASRQIDKANEHAALNLVSFDDIDFAPKRSTAPPVSLSQESVPIDNHILNWRDLVGLPPSNPVMKDRMPIEHDGVTPLLEK